MKINIILFTKFVKKDILIIQIYVADIIFSSTYELLWKEFEKCMKADLLWVWCASSNIFLSYKSSKKIMKFLKSSVLVVGLIELQILRLNHIFHDVDNRFGLVQLDWIPFCYYFDGYRNKEVRGCTNRIGDGWLDLYCNDLTIEQIQLLRLFFVFSLLVSSFFSFPPSGWLL